MTPGGSRGSETGRDRRRSERTEMAEQAVAVFADGTRAPCIIHDMSEPDGKTGFGMRVELINVPKDRVPARFEIHMVSGRVIQYATGWKASL